MYHFVYSSILILAFFILSRAKHTIFISQNAVKSYLPHSSESDVCMTPTCVIAAADILTSMDETVDPCEDFDSFACGGWIKRHEVPYGEPLLDMKSTIRKNIDRKLRELLEDKYESSDLPFMKIMKDFYKTCVDVDTLEKQGSEPLKKMLSRLGGWPVVEGSQWDESSFDWVDTLISFRKLGYDHEILLTLTILFEPVNETVTILKLEEPFKEKIVTAKMTLGLDDPEIAAYYRGMVKAAKRLGANESTAEKELLESLHFEMTLINIIPKEEKYGLKDKPVETLSTLTRLQKELPQIPWLKIINGILLNDETHDNEISVDGKLDFLIKLADLITSTEKRVIANYMLWRAVLQSKDYLSEEWDDIEVLDDSKYFKFPGEFRWKKCLSVLEKKMKVGLHSFYVRHFFSDESKGGASNIMKYVHEEFLKILEESDWMDDSTKEKAKEKAEAMKAFIGCPEELLSDKFMVNFYENLKITTNDNYLENSLALHKWDTDKEFSYLRKSSKDRYKMHKYSNLHKVFAKYVTAENSIVIPAGILQNVFYEKDRPNYMNFGGIGLVMGHEITHGFDSTGRKFDKNGDEVNWWDKESDERFIKKAKCIINQYDNYTIDLGMKVNGDQTQKDNIADNGGIKVAYRAYHTWTKDNGIEPLLPGVNYTQNQIFWISSARLSCSKFEPAVLKHYLLHNPHSPGKFRTIGTVSNQEEFSKDFKCSPDAPMNPKYKCEVW